MPIRNVATRLENIVLVEAARLLLGETESEQVVEFVNPFAMPPLSAWQDHERDRGFAEVHLARRDHGGSLRRTITPVRGAPPLLHILALDTTAANPLAAWRSGSSGTPRRHGSRGLAGKAAPSEPVAMKRERAGLRNSPCPCQNSIAEVGPSP